jgi:hypothetical protein
MVFPHTTNSEQIKELEGKGRLILLKGTLKDDGRISNCQTIDRRSKNSSLISEMY